MEGREGGGRKNKERSVIFMRIYKGLSCEKREWNIFYIIPEEKAGNDIYTCVILR